MFEILKAMLAMQEAARANGYAFTWDFHVDRQHDHDGQALTIRIPITDEDADFVDQMRQLLGP